MMDKIFDVIMNKAHVVIGTAYGVAILVFHLKTGKDLGPGVVNATYAFYAFLLGHAYTYQRFPDGSDTSGDK